MSTTYREPRFSSVVGAVGRVTFLEIVRERVLYNILLVAGGVCALGFVSARLSYTRPERIVMDFGLSALNLSCVLIAILVGSGMLSREIERRTFFVSLSRPISRPQFVVGKYFGLASVLALNWAIFSLLYVGLLAAMGPLGEVFSPALVLGLFMALLQCLVMAGVAVFFSTFSTAALSVVFSLSTYLIGHSITELRQAIGKIFVGGAAADIGSAAVSLFPNLEYFDLGTKVAYGLAPGWKFALSGSAYGILLIVLFLFMAGRIIRRREV